MNVNNGDYVFDTITEFEGVVVGVVDYITGCSQALVQPKVKKESGEWQESHWIDVDRLAVTATQYVNPSSVQEKHPGADKPAPKR